MNGLLCVTHPRYTVGMIVKNGIVVETAPYARRWAMGRTPAEVQKHAGPDAQCVWYDDRNEQEAT